MLASVEARGFHFDSHALNRQVLFTEKSSPKVVNAIALYCVRQLLNLSLTNFILNTVQILVALMHVFEEALVNFSTIFQHAIIV